jgi:hypothetical protein
LDPESGLKMLTAKDADTAPRAPFDWIKRVAQCRLGAELVTVMHHHAAEATGERLLDESGLSPTPPLSTTAALLSRPALR